MVGLVQWLCGANASIYSCHFLASWSGRMWRFSMGLFLISISPESLQLSATYGLSMGVVILVFGSIIGNWVDKTARLKAATLSMVSQNVLIATDACVILVLIILLKNQESITDWLRRLFYVIIIGTSVCSRLMREARIIIIERDWIVEMCAKDEHQLAVMTSSFRRLDLLTKILAPVVTGQIMTFAGLKIGCMFIAGWSLISLGIEYYLIKRVYGNVPALKLVKSEVNIIVVTEHEEQVKCDDSSLIGANKALETAEHNLKDNAVAVRTADRRRRSCSGPHCLRRIFYSFIILYRGVKMYFSCVTKWPGMALACLYLTVLGFDDITVGYATMQGLSGSILGIMMGVGACFGVLATFTYPFIVKKLGLPLTGVLALGLQVSCLTLCVVSVWLPGSPFDPFFSRNLQEINTSFRNCTKVIFSVHDIVGSNDIWTSKHGMGQQNITHYSNNTFCVGELSQHTTDPSLSVWVMIIGIVLARFGLWTADLTTVQIFLENVDAKQRGIVNGFQTSLNQLMDLLKYALVVALPHQQQFGLLVFISYAFIFTGWMLMGVNSVQSTKRWKIKNEISERQIN